MMTLTPAWITWHLRHFFFAAWNKPAMPKTPNLAVEKDPPQTGQALPILVPLQA